MTKKFYRFLCMQLIISIFYLGLSGCSEMSSISFAASDKERMATSFREKIIGHWGSGGAEYYIGPEYIFMVERGRASKFKYSIYESNESDRTMAIEISRSSGVGHKKQLKFAPNFRSLSEKTISEIKGESIELYSKWTYLNSKIFEEDKDVLNYRSGVEKGCASSMSKKNNSESDITIFCSCFADTLVDDLSREEERKLVAGDKKIEQLLFQRNFYKLPLCEKNLSKDAKF